MCGTRPSWARVLRDGSALEPMGSLSKGSQSTLRGASKTMRISLQPGLVRRTAITVTLIAFSFLAGLSSLGVPAASALPPGRHYEMVSPVHKGGFGVRKIGAVSARIGESVAYLLSGVFNGSAAGGVVQSWNYLAVRGASGWETAPMGAPASLLAQAGVDFSPDLEMGFALGPMGSKRVHNLVDQEGSCGCTRRVCRIRTRGGGGWRVEDPGEEVRVTPNYGYDTASPDFCHVLFHTSLEVVNSLLVPEAKEPNAPLFEYDSGCDGGSVSVALVGVNNKDKIIDRECRESELRRSGYYSI